MGIGFEVDGLRKAIASYNSPGCMQYNTVTNRFSLWIKGALYLQWRLHPFVNELGFSVAMGEL